MHKKQYLWYGIRQSAHRLTGRI